MYWIPTITSLASTFMRFLPISTPLARTVPLLPIFIPPTLTPSFPTLTGP
ncbi:hypothetical protein PG614_05070 [Riemerella anatipestifer]|nr:hypothetical protein [Riemerella anatipestifer]MDY3533221.1 hypothetical protein [Riemerella anatipestifer]MDY3535313.1 hypothetical protein [Riemerella anatipestifer]